MISFANPFALPCRRYHARPCPSCHRQEPTEFQYRPSLNLTNHVPGQDEDGHKDAQVIVESEDQPDRLLLETKIQKEDGFQKQQGTSLDVLPDLTLSSRRTY